MTARIFNVLIGTWLFLSSFAWPHTTAQRYAAMICGALTVLFSLFTVYNPGIRYMTAVVAVVLFVETLTLVRPGTMTFWHDAVIAIAIFFGALLDKGRAGVRRERELYGRT
ncbi:MAG TPA: hypothetical protein VN903_05730 [Polyangia bacterium]|jgi:dolichyl-phosphate-mannose--protein O-mannosyl transferase|nr:hypothetical protein [Polyangia bacterium]